MKTIVTIFSLWSRYVTTDKPAEYTVEVEADSLPSVVLDNAFALTNRDDRPLRTKVCATSSGDVMLLDGDYYLVEDCGFQLLTPEQGKAALMLLSHDTRMGYEWLVKNEWLPKL